MTDKQIIIDGVDVSECQHVNAYNPKKPICQRGIGVGGSPSVCNARCRYADEYRYKQQLKRKEQESKKSIKSYKNEIRILQETNEILCKEIVYLKKELDRK